MEEKQSMVEKSFEEHIKQLRKDINILERVKKGQIDVHKEGQANLVEEKYEVKRKGLTTEIDKLRQRILAKAAKIS